MMLLFHVGEQDKMIDWFNRLRPPTNYQYTILGDPSWANPVFKCNIFK